MTEIRWRHDPAAPHREQAPTGPAEAIALLAAGNAAFAGLSRDGGALTIAVTPEDLGFGSDDGTAPPQTPFAALLGCADARVPLELVLTQSANDLFIVRVAGNVLGAECVGSLDYALDHLPSVRLLGVVGHTGCGAVGAAVDAYLAPAGYLGVAANLPLRAIVDALMAAVHAAAAALAHVHGADVTTAAGYRGALIDTAVVLNAAIGADALQRVFGDRVAGDRGVGFGVYHLPTRTIGLPGADGWAAGLIPPPEDLPAFSLTTAGSAPIHELLTTAPTTSH